MEIVIFLVALFLVLDVAALTGWAPDTRDGRDWSSPNDLPTARVERSCVHGVGSSPASDRGPAGVQNRRLVATSPAGPTATNLVRVQGMGAQRDRNP